MKTRDTSQKATQEQSQPNVGPKEMKKEPSMNQLDIDEFTARAAAFNAIELEIVARLLPNEILIEEFNRRLSCLDAILNHYSATQKAFSEEFKHVK